MNDRTNFMGDLLGSFSKHVAPLDGECAEHGAAQALTRIGAPWKCPVCLEHEMAVDTHAKWLAKRTVDLMDCATIPARCVGQRFHASTEDMRSVRTMVAHFRDFILNEKAWAALIMVGTTGTGKTLAACELAQRLIERASLSVRYITAKGMIAEIQASYGREGKSEEGEIMRFAQYDLLILDEIDALPAKENSSLLLTEIVNRRYNDNKPVIAISNQSLGNMEKFVGARVHSRLHENAFLCDFKWGDFRKAQRGSAA
jgi:DNA replication protein DnaC